MIIITGTLRTNAANREAVMASCIAHSERSRAEPGCIAHHIHADCEDPHRLHFHEIWTDEAAVLTHFRVPESGAFVKELNAMLEVPAEMKLYRASEVSPAALAGSR